MRFVKYMICVLIVLSFGCIGELLFPSEPFLPCNSGKPALERGFLTTENELRATSKIVLLAESTNFDLYLSTLAANTYRVSFKKNKRINNMDSVYANLGYLDKSGKDYSSKYKVWFYRTGEADNCYEYSTQRAVGGRFVKGKPVFFILEKELGSVCHPDYYLIPSPLEPSTLRISFPPNQI